jgi:YaiO family outer membrane protein
MTKISKIACLASASMLALPLAFSGAAFSEEPMNRTAQLTFGALDYDNGFPDRNYVNLLVQSSVSSDTTLLFDAAYQTGEEDAAFGAVGLSHSIGGGSSVSASVGGSNSDLGVYPELFVDLGYEHVTPPATGLIYRTGISYSDYANDTEALVLRGELVKYFPPLVSGSYFVGQIGGNVTDSNPGSDLGWEVGAAGTMVLPGGWSYGLAASTGTASYELSQTSPIENDFVAVRPFITRTLGSGIEVIARGEFVDTEDYDIRGVSLGLKMGF